MKKVIMWQTEVGGLHNSKEEAIYSERASTVAETLAQAKIGNLRQREFYEILFYAQKKKLIRIGEDIDPELNKEDDFKTQPPHLSQEERHSFLEMLLICHNNRDTEKSHIDADETICVLLRRLGYDDIAEQFEQINKWYS